MYLRTRTDTHMVPFCIRPHAKTPAQNDDGQSRSRAQGQKLAPSSVGLGHRQRRSSAPMAVVESSVAEVAATEASSPVGAGRARRNDANPQEGRAQR